MGGGPAGLSAALRLVALQQQHNYAPLSIAVLEKAREHGAYLLSGAVLDPSALHELIPDWKDRGAPLDVSVSDDRIYYLTQNSKFRFPFTPSPLRNNGNYVISLSRFVKWLAEQAEGLGLDRCRVAALLTPEPGGDDASAEAGEGAVEIIRLLCAIADGAMGGDADRR